MDRATGILTSQGSPEHPKLIFFVTHGPPSHNEEQTACYMIGEWAVFDVRVLTIGDGTEYLDDRQYSDCSARDSAIFSYPSPSLYFNNTNEYEENLYVIQENMDIPTVNIL